MSTPSSLGISLPPRFNNSFWTSPEYRIGAEALYTRLQIGIDEDACVLALVQHRTESEYRHAELLATPSPSPSLPAPLFKGALSEAYGHGPRSLASIRSNTSQAFRTVEQQTLQVQANTHGKVARNLERSILVPFGKWADEHRDRIKQSWDFVDANLTKHERLRAEVERLRLQYETKCRQADEAEDDARFAGGESSSSPSISSGNVEATPNTSDATLPTSASALSLDDDIKGEKATQTPKPLDSDRLKRRETLRKQFGFRTPSGGATDSDAYTSPSARSNSAELPPKERSSDDIFSTASDGLKRSGTISHALTNALSKASEVPAFQNLRAAVGGLAEPRHIRLRKDADAAEHSYRDTVRQLDRARCALEEILLEHFDLCERWETNRLVAIKRVLASFNAAFHPLVPTLASSMQQCAALEPALDPLTSLAHTVFQARTGPYTPFAEVFQPYYHDDASSLAGAGTAGFGMDLVAFMRAETLASEDDDAVADHVRAGAGNHGKGMPPLPLALAALLGSLERRYSDASIWARSAPQEKVSKSESLNANEEKRKAWIYEVPLANIHACREAIISHLLGNSVPGANVGAGLDDKLKRFDSPTLAATVKLWALELVDSLVPMALWDSVTNTYQAAADQERDSRLKPSRTIADEAKDKANNVIADSSTEGNAAAHQSPVADSASEKGKGRAEGLDPVLADKIRNGVLSDLGVILSRLPKIHLVCLDAIIGHLTRLVTATPTEESDSLFVNKLSLSLSRVFVRPKRETPATVRSLAPVLLAYDLITFYNDLLPKVLDTKAKEGEVLQAYQRNIPIRKRTKPVDQRLSRSRISQGASVPPLPQSSAATHTAPSASPEMLATSNVAAPTLVTDNIKNEGKAENADEDDSTTPIASRILPMGQASSGGEKSTPQPAAVASASMLSPRGAEADRAASPSSQGDGSAYGTPDEDERPKTTAAAGAATSPPPLDEDKPLTNVARLSRQFGNPGSGSGSGSGSRGSKVRGPRAANPGGGSSGGK